jgi:S1-C subfamily serine protease
MLNTKIKGIAILSILLLSPLIDVFAAPPAPIDLAFTQIVCVIGKSPLGVLEGSGFVVAPGYILTSYHGLEKAKELTVQFEKGTRYPADIFSVSNTLDLALLSFPDTKTPWLSFADARSIKVGAPIYTVGCPFGLHHSMTRGIISAGQRTILNRPVFQTDMAINPGNSGGPVLNQKGEVIGIVLGVLPEARGISFALPAREATRFLGETFSQMGTLFFDAKRDVDAAMAFTQAIRFAPRADIADLTKKRERALRRGNK